MVAIECRNICKSFNSKKVLDCVNLSIDKGTCTSILGRSGAGKTTFLKILGGIETPDSGEIFVFGKKENQSKEIGFIFQDFQLFHNMTAMQNIKYATKFLKNKPNDSVIFDFAKTLSLPVDVLQRYPESLSGGQKQKVAIIRSMILDKRILLLDEPTASLDETSKEEALNVLLELKKSGITILMITHDLSFSKSLSDKEITFFV